MLQVALDLTDLERVLGVAELAVEGGAEILEAGTPLIKMLGVGVVSELRRRFPGKTVVADMKTMDVGYLETEIAAKAGADVVTVLAAAYDATVKGSIEAARRYGVKVMADMMAVEQSRVLERATDLEWLGVDYICLHVGKDAQPQRGSIELLYQTLEAVTNAVEIPVAAAGGITAESVGRVVKAGAGIVVVGGAITGAENPAEAAASILREARQAYLEAKMKRGPV